MRVPALLAALVVAALAVAACQAQVPPAAVTAALPAVADPVPAGSGLARPVEPAPVLRGDAVVTVPQPPGTVPQAQPALVPAQPVAPAPLPEPAPRAATLRQLTADGCCVQPSFSPDGGRVQFLDRPPGAPVGIWAIPVAGGSPVLASERIGYRTPDGRLVTQIQGEQAIVTDEETGARWVLPTGGATPSFSPGRTRVAWTRADQTGNFDQRRTDFWIAAADGSGARRVASLVSAGFHGWLDEDRALISGREGGTGRTRVYWILDAASGNRAEIITLDGVRAQDLAPGGRWLALYLAFSPDAALNGLQVLDIANARLITPAVPAVGAVRWAGPDRLIYLPARNPGEESMRLLAIDLPSGQVTPLTDPAVTPFVVGNNDWEVSPDGKRVVFVSAADRNLWVLDLP